MPSEKRDHIRTIANLGRHYDASHRKPATVIAQAPHRDDFISHIYGMRRSRKTNDNSLPNNGSVKESAYKQGNVLAKQSVRKQLFFKQAKFLQSSDLTLQDLITRALRKLSVGKRQETMNLEGDSQWVRFVNSPRQYSGCKFGVLTLYSPGTHHLVIDTAAINDEKDELDVSKYPPPVGKQFTEPTLCFLIRENFVVFVQSKALRSSDLEHHLNWLLHRAGSMGDEQRVELTDAIPAETQRKMEKAPLKRISLGVPLLSAPASGKSIGNKMSSAVNQFAKGIGLDVLKGILSDKEYSSIKLEELTETPDIQISLEIKVVGRRKSDDNDDKVMKKIMRELRHVEDPSFLKIDVQGVGKIDGSLLRVQDFKQIDAYDGVLDIADAYEVMRNWLETIIDVRAIKADK